MSNTTDFMSIDFGVSQEHPTMMQTIEVMVNPGSILRDYAKAFTEEAYRLNYDKANAMALVESEINDYLLYLVTKRIEVVNDSCPDFRNLKLLFIPSFFQFLLSMIGVCEDREVGLKFVPVLGKELKSKLTFDEAVKTSSKIASFEKELQLVQDAMPRGYAGDLSFMSTALIGDYVASCRKVEHPIVTYASAFMNMKLVQEATYGVLYRRLYGDKSLIAHALVAERNRIL